MSKLPLMLVTVVVIVGTCPEGYRFRVIPKECKVNTFRGFRYSAMNRVIHVGRGLNGYGTPSPPSSSSNRLRKYDEPFEYTLKVIHKPDEVDLAVQEIYRKCMHFPVVGLDCEWTPVRRKNQKANVALLQIATIDGSCVLFRTCKMAEVQDSLAAFLADPNILKVGVGISTDVTNLKDKFPTLNLYGCFDLRHMTRMCNIFTEKESLGGLSKALLGVPLQKDIILNCVWENEKLKESWLQYAALDSLVGVRIFQTLLPLFHEQESDESFHGTLPSELIKRYFTSNNSACFQFLDKKL